MLVIILLVLASFLDCELLKGRALLFIFASPFLAQSVLTKCLMDGWVGECDTGRLLGGGELRAESCRKN